MRRRFLAEFFASFCLSVKFYYISVLIPIPPVMSKKSIYWLNEDSRTFLKRGYLQDGQTPEQRIREIAEYAAKILGLPDFALKFESYMHKGWFSLSSPIWSNFAAGRGLPISCNGSAIPDTIEGILEKSSEVAMMTKHGAGTSGYFGELRPRGAAISSGGSSSGPVHFLEIFEKMMDVISQGNVRRGSFAAYLPVEHPDIEEFLKIRSDGSPIQQMSIGVCIGDEWMKAMVDGDKDKRRVWAQIIKKRFESGYPYIFFTDNSNNAAPDVYRDKKLKIHASNLCCEIHLPSSAEESFVCNLSSMNLLHYDEWKDTDAVETLTYFLDAVMTDYIEKTASIPFMEAAHRFAKNHRALGLGVLGWHSYLQSKMIPFESMEAKLLNTQIHRLLRDKSLAASREMAIRYGEAPILAASARDGWAGVWDGITGLFGIKRPGYGRRNTTLMAIAPTTSSSFILGQVSPSIELLVDNYYVKDLAKGKFTYQNPYLKKVLAAHGKDKHDVWKSILLKGGSVQHLTFLTDHERAVFKTFAEISQKEIVIQAAARQKFIDQGQSLNLMIHPKTPPKEVSELLIEGWRLGIKGFYYQRGVNLALELGRSNMSCASCEA